MSTAKKRTGQKTPGSVNPAEYAQFLGGLDLARLRLRAAEAKLLADSVDPSRPIDLDVHVDSKYRAIKDGTCLVKQDYRLEARYCGSKKALFRVRCDYEVLYKVAQPMTDAYFAVFKNSSLVMNTWPFLREYVHNATARMGVPPMDLPLVKTGGLPRKGGG